MKSSLASALIFTAGLRLTAANGNSTYEKPAPTTTSESASWSIWPTTECVPSTDLKTTTDYVTVTGPTTTKTETRTETKTDTEYQTVTQVSTVTESASTVSVPVTQVYTVTISATGLATVTETATITEAKSGAESATATQHVFSTVTETSTITQGNDEVVTATTTQVVTVSISAPVPESITVTEVDTITESAATVTVVSLATSLQTLEQTTEDIVSAVATIVDTATIVNEVTATVTIVTTATVRQTSTINNDVTATITSIGSVTVSAECSSSCSQELTGLVTCPSRIINPTYTPPTPLPSNYLWGCPPGKLCHPKRECCNFEQNPPAESYVCAPEECMPVADLPPLETWLDYENVNDTCAWLTPMDDYFNLNPTFFGLDFDIFNIYGQPSCSPVLPPSIVTVEVPSPVTVATTVTALVTSGTWAAWPAPPEVTKRADLSERDLEKKAVAVASECYAVCDYAAAVYQSIGNAPELCSSDGQWSSAFARVTSCTEKYSATGVTSVASVLNDPILYCRRNSKRQNLFGRRAVV